MKRIVALAGALMLAACGGSEDTGGDLSDEETSAEEAAAGSDLAVGEAAIPAPVEAKGGFLRVFADGSQQINIWRDDMTFYHANQVNSPIGTWSGDGNKVCFDPAAPGRATYCRSFGIVGADGTFTAASDDGDVLIATRLDRDLTPGAQAIPQAGAFLLTSDDGEQFIAINSPDGSYHGAELVGKGTYRIVDGKRCARLDGLSEGCETVGDWKEDSSFDGTLQQGVSFTVKPLL